MIRLNIWGRAGALRDYGPVDILQSWWAKLVAWGSYALDILHSWLVKLVAWGGYALDMLHSWVADHFIEIGNGVRDRLTEANGFKVALLLAALYLTLQILVRINAIKGAGAWEHIHIKEDDKLEEDKVRIGRGNFTEPVKVVEKKYDDLAGTIEFRLPQPSAPWWRRMWRRTPKLRKECTFEVPLTGQLYRDLFFVNPIVANHLANLVNNGNSDSGDEASIQDILDNAEFNVVVKRRNNLSFLLKHPDPTLRTTAWVILVGTLFEIFRSVIFESPSPPSALTPPVASLSGLATPTTTSATPR
jgi:hypothetical protein